MNEATLSEIIAELRDGLVGRKFGKIFSLGREVFAVDFRPHDGSYLLISGSPSDPRIHLVQRKLKELLAEEKSPGSFLSVLRKHLTHSVLLRIEKVEHERVIHMTFESRDEFALNGEYTLTAQLTGRSSNVFLLDSANTILDRLRQTFGQGQEKGDAYLPPERTDGMPAARQEAFPLGEYSSLSEALDADLTRKRSDQAFKSLSTRARQPVSAKLKKLVRLKKKLKADLLKHGEPEEWKRLGDLVNANISTAKRSGETVTLIDYFDDELREISLTLDERVPLSEAAEKFYMKYSKSKTAAAEIQNRLAEVGTSIKKEEAKLSKLDAAIARKDTEYLESIVPKKKAPSKKRKARNSEVSKYAREFTSSDGFKILVGKRSKDNDYLTFRIARSLDTWLHAADYPGSHVVIRRQSGRDIPQRTLLEAARLAAFYSKARNETKAAVRYTQKKFVSKPKGTAPGLVSLSSAKTIMVAPGVPEFEPNSAD